MEPCLTPPFLRSLHWGYSYPRGVRLWWSAPESGKAADEECFSKGIRVEGSGEITEVCVVTGIGNMSLADKSPDCSFKEQYLGDTVCAGDVSLRVRARGGMGDMRAALLMLLAASRGDQSASVTASPTVVWSEDRSINVYETATLATEYTSEHTDSPTRSLARIGIPHKIPPKEMTLMAELAGRVIRDATERAVRRGEVPLPSPSFGFRPTSVPASVPMLIQELVKDGVKTAVEWESLIEQYREFAKTFIIDGEPVHALIEAGTPTWMRTPLRLY